MVQMSIDAENRRIGNRYRLLEPLGRGGMGAVWAGRDEVLGRDVAIKEVIPPPGLTAEQQAEVRTRTLREARAAARIKSRSAVTVFDVVEDDGRPWIVMELLRARTLSDIVRERGQLPADQVAQIGLRVLEALVAAHEAGVLHRDVKPSNVMISADGQVVLTDFGIATLEGDPALTTTGMLVGSPAYIAPERARGGAATTASDLWSLGCTMFTAVEGRTPFEREGSLATLNAVITEEPVTATRAGALGPVLAALLEKDPDRRPSADETGRMLEAAAGAQTPALPPPVANTAVLPQPEVERPQALPVTPVGSPRRHSTRGRRIAAVLTALVLLAALGVGAFILINQDADNDQAGPPDEATVSTPAEETEADPDAGQAGGEVTATETESESAEPTDEEAAEPTEDAADGIPDGFVPYEDPSGFTIAIPAGWEPTIEGPRTTFVEPGGGRFLRVDQTTTPQDDPVADWENQEGPVSGRLGGYERIVIEPVEYRDYDAADWEFTWQPDDGERLHVRSRNLITTPGEQAYALYWSVPDSQWEDSLPLFDTFAETFKPVD